MAGKSRFDDPDLRKQQGKVILARRLAGESVDTLAESFQLHRVTVLRRIQEAKREADVHAAKDRVLTELLNPAIEAFKTLLAEGDYNAARDVLQGLGVLPKNGPPQTELTQKVEMTLDEYREMRQRVIHDEIGSAQASPEYLPPGTPPAFGPETLILDGEDVGAGAEAAPDPGEPSEGI